MTKSKREELGQIVIRPPEGMRERIKAAADANGRSMNAEIVATLEKAYPPPPSLSQLQGAFVALQRHLEALHVKASRKDEMSEQEAKELDNNFKDTWSALGELGEAINEQAKRD